MKVVLRNNAKSLSKQILTYFSPVFVSYKNELYETQHWAEMSSCLFKLRDDVIAGNRGEMMYH